MQAYVKKIQSLTLLAIMALTAANCSVPQQKPGHEVTFAVTGNTSPASPFTGYPEKLEQVFGSINADNPMFVIHTGNIIQGGPGDVGITANDITRQYQMFLQQKKSLRPILHILAGERDIYDGSLELFSQFTGEKFYYSFNYGNAHFILLHILNGKHAMDNEQRKWLERDLETHRYDAAIFIFSHYPILSSPQSGIRYRDGDKLHELFARYPVKAVFSGSVKNLYEYEKDGIRYTAAGCFGFNSEDWHWSFNQYYIVRYDGGKLAVRAVRVNFPAGAYRPKIIQEAPEKKN
jgi:hypothetical protein